MPSTGLVRSGLGLRKTREERGGSRERVGVRREKRRKERKKKKRQRKKKKKERKKKFFEFSKLEFILFSDFWIKISFSHNFDCVFNFVKYDINMNDKSQIYMRFTLIYLVFCIVYHLFLAFLCVF